MKRAPAHPCPHCGANDWRLVSTRSPHALAWRWLTQGRNALAPEYACGRCGNRQSAYATATLGGSRPPRIVMVVRALRAARTAQPAPLAYLLAFAAGAVAGVVFAWSWWVAGLAFTAATWLVFASSILWGPRMPHRTLRSTVGWAIAPERAAARDARDQAERFRRTRLPLYGLPDRYEGSRWLGGWGGYDDGDLTGATLAHGDPKGSTLRVEVSLSPHDAGLMHAERSLAHHAALDELQPNPDMSDLIRRTTEILNEPHSFERTHATIRIDGEPVEFAVMSAGRFWVAAASVGDAHLRLHGERFPLDDVALVRVTDVEPYIAGAAAIRQRRG